jgi:hypothetical protein
VQEQLRVDVQRVHDERGLLRAGGVQSRFAVAFSER